MNTSSRTNRRRRNVRRVFVALALGVGVIALGACNDEQRRGLGEIDVRDELHDRVEQAVEDGGQTINGDLECDSTIDDEGRVTASCVGVTDLGDDVTGAFAGTADVEAEECAATLAITIGDESVVTEPDASCFNG